METKNFLLAIFAMIALFFSSCKKDDGVAPSEPVPLPLILRYNLADSSAVLLNNEADPNCKIIGYTGKYSIRIEHSGGPFDLVFVQHDSGNVYFSTEKKASYMVLIFDKYYDGYHIKAKFDHNADDFYVNPSILVDTTQYFVLTNKVTGRTMSVPAQEFIKQGFLVIWYDVIQQ